MTGRGGLIRIDQQPFRPVETLAQVELDRVLARLALAVEEPSAGEVNARDHGRRAAVARDALLQGVATRDAVDHAAGVGILALQPGLEAIGPAILHPSVFVDDLRAEVVVHHRFARRDGRRRHLGLGRAGGRDEDKGE